MSARCCIWCKINQLIVGYIALGYGYAIEFAGRDAFIDEFYILPEFQIPRHVSHQDLCKQVCLVRRKKDHEGFADRQESQ